MTTRQREPLDRRPTIAVAVYFGAWVLQAVLPNGGPWAPWGTACLVVQLCAMAALAWFWVEDIVARIRTRQWSSLRHEAQFLIGLLLPSILIVEADWSWPWKAAALFGLVLAHTIVSLSIGVVLELRRRHRKLA